MLQRLNASTYTDGFNFKRALRSKIKYKTIFLINTSIDPCILKILAANEDQIDRSLSLIRNVKKMDLLIFIV